MYATLQDTIASYIELSHKMATEYGADAAEIYNRLCQQDFDSGGLTQFRKYTFGEAIQLSNS